MGRTWRCAWALLKQNAWRCTQSCRRRPGWSQGAESAETMNPRCAQPGTLCIWLAVGQRRKDQWSSRSARPQNTTSRVTIHWHTRPRCHWTTTARNDTCCQPGAAAAVGSVLTPQPRGARVVDAGFDGSHDRFMLEKAGLPTRLVSTQGPSLPGFE